jgi:hypothetical protein
MKDETSRHLLLAAAEGVSVRKFENTSSSGSSASRNEDGGSTLSPRDISQFPREAVAEYIAEMCEAMAYMARADQCDDLSNLLLEAAHEAGRCKTAGSNPDRPG